MKEFICQVDAEDRITFVDANWVSFAAENAAPALTLEAVKGRLLWDYIADQTSRHLYQSPVSVPFRCDGPDCRRFMNMFIVSLEAGAVEFHTVLLRAESRPRVDLLDPDFPRTDKFIIMCAWCKKVQAVEWLEVEEAARQLHLFEQPRLPQITHGVCPACMERLESGFIPTDVPAGQGSPA
jgi:hypothetical protein